MMSLKRECPFEEVMLIDSENSFSAAAATASIAHAMKRVRMLEEPQSNRKRVLPSSSFKSSNGQNPLFSLQQLEAVREEGRAQLRNYAAAVENLGQAVEATNADRERLLHENKILKAGVLRLKQNHDTVAAKLQHTENLLHQSLQRTRQLESAIVAATSKRFSLSCGRDETNEFRDRDVY